MQIVRDIARREVHHHEVAPIHEAREAALQEVQVMEGHREAEAPVMEDRTAVAEAQEVLDGAPVGAEARVWVEALAAADLQEVDLEAVDLVVAAVDASYTQSKILENNTDEKDTIFHNGIGMHYCIRSKH